MLYVLLSIIKEAGAVLIKRTEENAAYERRKGGFASRVRVVWYGDGS